MRKSVAEIFTEATELDEKNRAKLSGLLLESIDSEADPDVEATWAAEIDRRSASVDDGSAELVPWEAVKRRSREKLALSFDRS